MNLEEFKRRFPKTYFIKTKKFFDEPDVKGMKEAFIPDEDMKDFPLDNGWDKDTRLYPLSIADYPRVLSRMTGMEAGAWAIGKCLQQHWAPDYDNVQCCLANLEMDY